MEIRAFRPDDGDFCFRTRSTAFIEKFYDEIGAKVVSLCVNAYLPKDYVELSERDGSEVFVAEDDGERVGFFTLEKIDARTVKLPLIYFRLELLGRSYGRKAMEYMESWVRSNWPEVTLVVIDTIIPGNTSGFYAKMNYRDAGDSISVFRGEEVKSKRFEKRLD